MQSEREISHCTTSLPSFYTHRVAGLTFHSGSQCLVLHAAALYCSVSITLTRYRLPSTISSAAYSIHHPTIMHTIVSALHFEAEVTIFTCYSKVVGVRNRVQFAVITLGSAEGGASLRGHIFMDGSSSNRARCHLHGSMEEEPYSDGGASTYSSGGDDSKRGLIVMVAGW